MVVASPFLHVAPRSRHYLETQLDLDLATHRRRGLQRDGWRPRHERVHAPHGHRRFTCARPCSVHTRHDTSPPSHLFLPSPSSRDGELSTETSCFFYFEKSEFRPLIPILKTYQSFNQFKSVRHLVRLLISLCGPN